MTQHTRRELLQRGLGGVAVALAAAVPRLDAAEPALGMIFPPANYPVPPEALRLYPARLLGLSGHADGFGRVLASV